MSITADKTSSGARYRVRWRDANGTHRSRTFQDQTEAERFNDRMKRMSAVDAAHLRVFDALTAYLELTHPGHSFGFNFDSHDGVGWGGDDDFDVPVPPLVGGISWAGGKP